MKKLIPVNLTVNTSMDADAVGHRLTECIEEVDTSSNVINLIKVKVEEKNRPSIEIMGAILKSLNNLIKSMGVTNFITIPVGWDGIEDVSIDYLKVVDDESNS